MMVTSTDENDHDPMDQVVQKSATSTDDPSVDQSEKTGDTEFFDVAQGSPRNSLEPEAGEASDADESDIESSESGSSEGEDEETRSSGSDGSDQSDAESSESGSSEGEDEESGSEGSDQSDIESGESSESGSSEGEDDESRSSGSEGSDQSDIESGESGESGESSESGSSEGEDDESRSMDSEGSDQSGEDTTKGDTEIEDTARSREDIQPEQEAVGTLQDSLENPKEETTKVPKEENELLSGNAPNGKSSEQNDLAIEPVLTNLSSFDSLNADIDSMREVSVSIENLEEVTSSRHELKDRKPKSTDGEESTPNKDNRTDLSEIKTPTVQEDPLKENEADEEKSSNHSKSTNESQKQGDKEEEEETLEVKPQEEGTMEEDEAKIESSDSISSEDSSPVDDRPKSDGVVEIRSTSSASDVAPPGLSTEAKKPDGNNSTPKLEASSLDPPVTLPIGDDQKDELKHLEDILRGLTPTGLEPNVALDHSSTKNDEIESKSGQNMELEHLEDLIRDSTTSGRNSHPKSKESVSSRANEAVNDPDKSSSLQHSDAQFSSHEKNIPAKKKSTNALETTESSMPPTHPHDTKNDARFDVPSIIRSVAETKSSTPDLRQDDEGSSEGLSVFSNATSGQDFLRSVSNAKKTLDEIDKEMRKLKGVTAPREKKVEEKTNINPTNDNDKTAPVETNHDVKNLSAEVPRENQASKPNKRVEPPSQKVQGGSKHSSDEKKKKQRRKTSKKKQVHPEKGKQNGPMDPDGKVIPRTRYNKRGTERDTQSFSDVGGVEENPYQNDPPMVIDGHLEPEEPPAEKNDTDKADLPIEKKKRKKKKKKKKERPPEEEDADHNMHSVVSSRMDRGDDGWSVPVDEVNMESEASDTYYSNDPPKSYDPWEEVPCSWCCRYLPHTLVVATTQAYRLDRADEKENGFTID